MDKAIRNIIDNIDDYNKLGKNHKILKNVTHEGQEIYQISGSFGARVRYIIKGGSKEIIKCFNKSNHETTDRYD